MVQTIVLYLIILVGKMIEVTMATTRIVLITKGEKLKGAIIGFFEVIIWAILIANVLKDITADPIKLVIYSIGFSLGNYLGTTFEQKLGFGTVRIESIVKEEHGVTLARELRNKGFAVTVIEGQGKDFKRHVLIMHIKRKRTEEAVSMIKNIQGNVVITVNEIKPVYGGYGILKK